ncbi:MAG: hypothetical protein ACI8X5_003219 [Planctomycetota bacterium]|jgi:hypothetical protein
MSRSIPRAWFAPLLALSLAWPSSAVEETPPANLTAEELLEHPAEHIGESIVLTVQFESKVESWNPFVTRFGSGDFSAWGGWSDTQFPWRESDFKAPLIRVFARHESPVEWALASAETYDRYALTCRVSSVFANRPWLEVIAAKPLLRGVGEGSVMHATRGLEFIEKGAWLAAVGEFERASNGPLHEAARTELERLSEYCRSKLPLELYRPLDQKQR